MSSKPLVYLAGPLFSDAERSYNSFLKHLIGTHAEVYLPQEDGLLITDLLGAGMSVEHASRAVFKNDINAIHRCDILFILLDGRAVDEGAAFELGYAYSLGKTCISLQTDFRRLAPFGNNPMLTGAISRSFSSAEDAVAWIRDFEAKGIASKSRG
ncbi:nucleoside 2-deoxyribosyltransferase [Paraburkholderia caledonica]|uniref:Nucleoside 2-deoxyribosyltransferase n=1 Tax=Paraburkholderia caledonica TaxID=134536 RepID=A0AB73IQ94_9BURK|nr:nucleoside 2-deoxyribosyltransferase [Paraburkholderia caledonica]